MMDVFTVNSSIYSKLYSLNEYQKRFNDKIIIRIYMQDTDELHFSYDIQMPILSMNINIDDLTELVAQKLFLQPCEAFTTHLIALQVLSEKFNPKKIGICLDKEIENLVKDKLEQENKQLEAEISRRF